MKLAAVTAICVAHEPAYSTEAVQSFVGEACPNMLQSALSVLGSRAKGVSRMMATDCPVSCAENVVVGFADGHLEGMLMVPVEPGTGDATGLGRPAGADVAAVVLLSTDWRWAAYPAHVLPASAWPWKGEAPFEAPKVARTAVPRAPSALANRTALPYCGLTWVGPGPETNPGARTCFARSVRTGHPAEYIEHGAGTEGQDLWELYRFSGSGAVMRWNLAVGAYSDGKWSSAAIPYAIYDV